MPRPFRVLGYSEAGGAARSGFSVVFQNLMFAERYKNGLAAFAFEVDSSPYLVGILERDISTRLNSISEVATS
jgi:hypothetical protein